MELTEYYNYMHKKAFFDLVREKVKSWLPDPYKDSPAVHEFIIPGISAGLGATIGGLSSYFTRQNEGVSPIIMDSLKYGLVGGLLGNLAQNYDYWRDKQYRNVSLLNKLELEISDFIDKYRMDKQKFKETIKDVEKTFKDYSKLYIMKEIERIDSERPKK